MSQQWCLKRGPTSQINLSSNIYQNENKVLIWFGKLFEISNQIVQTDEKFLNYETMGTLEGGTDSQINWTNDIDQNEPKLSKLIWKIRLLTLNGPIKREGGENSQINRTNDISQKEQKFSNWIYKIRQSTFNVQVKLLKSG